MYSLLCRSANVRPGSHATLPSDKALSRFSRNPQELNPASQQAGNSCTNKLRQLLHGKSAARLCAALENSTFAKTALLLIVLLMTSMVMSDGVLTPALSGG